MADERQIVPVDADRLARLRNAVTLASEGAYEAAAGLLGAGIDDGFGAIEQALQTFIVELRVAIQQSEMTLDDLIASKKELQTKLHTIESQRATIRELSSPLIDVWEGVITVPLIGVLDTGRVKELTEHLLARITSARTRWILLDMTGIDGVATNLAADLMQLARAVQLMGAQCLLTGIRPQVARTFIEFGFRLDELRPMATLKDGIEFCIARQR